MAEINHIQEDCLQVALVSEVLLLFYLPGSCEPIETIIKSSARTHNSHGYVHQASQMETERKVRQAMPFYQESL